MPPSSAEFAAYIGAASWVPQIIRWGYKWYAKPQVRIIPDNFPDVGFTNFGPIFNIRVAIAVDRKDSIIDQMTATLRHNSGDSHTLTWMGINETFSEISDQSGNRQVVERKQNAVALKLSTSVLTEKFIKFQDPEFHHGYTPALKEATAHEAFLRKDDPNYQDKLLASEQMHRLLEEYKKYFWWKAGKYSVAFAVHSPIKVFLHENFFTFEINQQEADNLRRNLELIKDAYEGMIKKGLPGYIHKDVPWTWINPQIDRKNK
jgi:hypothetical protein